MGRIFALPPSPFEVEHWRSILAAERYQDAHDGALPDMLAWNRLERRYDLDPERFTVNHENIAAMIERARQDHGHGPGRPDVWPIDHCSPYQADCGCEPRPAQGGGSQVVPEPAAWMLSAIAIVAFISWRAWK